MLLLLGLLALVALLVQPPAAGQREVVPVVSEDFNDEEIQAGIGRILEAGGDGVDAAVTKFSASRATKRVRRL